jgi:hypothetical protein
VMICAGAGIPTGLMLKSVLMAASWLPSLESNPNPSQCATMEHQD